MLNNQESSNQDRVGKNESTFTVRTIDTDRNHCCTLLCQCVGNFKCSCLTRPASHLSAKVFTIVLLHESSNIQY